MRRNPGPGLLVGLGLATMLACDLDPDHDDDDNGFRRDVIACEDAVAHLAACCPGFRRETVECNYHYVYDRGCGVWENSTTYPSLTTEVSTCIRRTSCDDLVKNDVCGRAAQAAPRTDKRNGEGDGDHKGPLPAPPPTLAVCP